MQLVQVLVLGAIAGFTIYLGLPLARVRALSTSARGVLSMFATGIILFLLFEILEHALEPTEHALEELFEGGGAIGEAAVLVLMVTAGLVLGLLSLAIIESRFLPSGPGLPSSQHLRQLALMIASGIGFHNFSEGLAIGQSYAAGETSLALLLIIGFGLHNATEGFGIAGPLTGEQPSWRFLGLVGLIGGGPTFLGTLLGQVFVSESVSVLFLSLAAGALIYVIRELLNATRRQAGVVALMTALLAGFLFTFATELVLEIAGG